ncbi:MAG: T9SS type A sorting domain-containing protein [Tannerella sp.]|jgi:hypothetical protein|nr:T9SS type A sorting domain-containing protein [Tannerella sp.]
MKYTGLIFILILLWSDCIYAQDAGYYKIFVYTPTLKSGGSAKNGGGSAEISAGGKIFQEGKWGEFANGDVLTMYAATAQTFLAGAKPAAIAFYGHRWGDDAWSSPWNYEATSYTYITGFYPYYNNYVSAAFAGYANASTLIKINPVAISLFYRDATGNLPVNPTDNFLPTDDNITLKATTGFPNSVYPSLYYRISTTGVTGTIPLGNPVKTFKALDFLSMEQLDNIIRNKGNIDFWVNYPNADSCPVITLFPMLSAPKIVSATGESIVCYGDVNGKIKIKFDRALRTGERLYISLSGDEFREKDEITDILVNNEVTITGLPAGSYNIGLLGTYNVTGGVVNTYTTGQNHTVHNITVPDRPAVNLSGITRDPVHCPDGMDGKVNFDVSGGNDSYFAYLLNSENDTLSRKNDITSGSHTFSELYRGNYDVYVRDGNGCDYDINGTKTRRSVTVDQPAEKVRISVIHSREATGYGRSTGWATVGANGGSDGYSFTWAKLNPPTLMPAASGTDTSRLANLPTGHYHARVEDQNYNLAYPRTEVNTRGCFDTVTIFIDQPPELIAATEETHIVTCHGDSDGQLQAHAFGGRPFNPAQDNGRTLPYNYEWFKTENNTDKPIGGNDSILSNLRTGYYKVKVTDRNIIDTTSLMFRLVQPDTVIAVATALQQVLCDGDSTGMAEVAVTGGTPPYTYQWTTAGNDRTVVAENLSRGIYTVFVRDSRYRTEAAHKRCTAEAHVSIKSPDGMAVQAATADPACSGHADGSIEPAVSGGTPPYRYLWENGNTAKDRNNLAGGEYTVTIADANGCHITEKYILTEPDPVMVSLGGDITLCAGQQISIGNLYRHDQMLDFRWTDGNGNLLSTDAELTVGAAGPYKLTAISPEGCTGEDEITVKQSDSVLYADFVISSQIPKDREVHIVNIMRSEFDSIRWILPEPVTVSEISDDRVSLTFFRTGEYTVGLHAFSGYCRDILYKTVQVLPSSEIPEYNDSEPFLKRFVVFPNPSSGNFSAFVELREPADYRLLLYNEFGVLLETKEIHNRDREETFFSRNDLSNGIYFLRFVSNEHVSAFKIIIQ